jgi:hypothetical protein
MSVNKRYIKAVEKAVDDLIQAEHEVKPEPYSGGDYITIEDAARFARYALESQNITLTLDEIGDLFQEWAQGTE